MKKTKININDIYGVLDNYLDYDLKPIKTASSGFELVAIINNAFDDTFYYIKPNSSEKILYYLSK